MRITFLLLILTARVALGQSDIDVRGSICGSVLDENGSPASHVRVTAIREPGPGGSSIGFPFSLTDQLGRAESGQKNETKQSGTYLHNAKSLTPTARWRHVMGVQDVSSAVRHSVRVTNSTEKMRIIHT
jgi:hypothetical protein